MTKEEFIIEVSKLGINLTETMLCQLEEYYKLMIEYNNKVNLTRIVVQEEVYLKHFYDSLTICKEQDLTKALNLCDVGTGAGLPGIVLKIVFPNLKIVLIEALEKRVKFLNLVIKALNLKDIVAIHARMEDYASQNVEKFDLITSRAVAKTSILLEMAVRALKKDGQIILYKAEINEELDHLEILEKELGLKLINKEEFYLPKENSKRTLLNFKKVKPTSSKYPRPFAKIKNNPL